ncbi:hypothetical protein SAMN02745216_00160 [Desulfatibacillum alkenivorans DSM 16219]|jgi:hypothetical protein|uniref:Uncharacterized protein n=1 Tax=Desulfatibacillum alkenivorans DSM 16219 TaxID=1121393 RepID=A0A1M6C681_9BACT|nr:hypothetical protein [Desulfatibacillum alkenivorans]SHI56472.1 hypothetical protein SAMN02745216_00160 [Desulfatibacillum alkenivorans DSM 16219]
MKKLMNMAIVLLGCAIIAAPIVWAASAPGSGSLTIDTVNATITKAVAQVGGATISPTSTSPTSWTYDLGGAPAGVPVSVRILGAADGAGAPAVEVSGDVDVSKGVCRDKSNRQRCNADILNGVTDYCDCTGMTPSAGDKLVIRVVGEVLGAISSIPNDVF